MSTQPPDADPHAAALNERVLALLGLARRAGRLAVGATAVQKMVQNGARPLVVLARDAGKSQRERCRNLRPIRGLADSCLTRAELARHLGRADLVVVAVADRGFVQGLVKLGVVAEPE
jgi:hypothetical protein